MSLLNEIVRRAMDRYADRKAKTFLAACDNPRDAQRALLLETIRREAPTGYGRDHHFGEIRTVDDFRRNVPVSTYESFEPYVERVKNGEVDALFSGQKLVMFALSSGTTQSRKFIPVTPRFVEIHRRAWYLWGLAAFRQHPPQLLRGKLNLGGDPEEFFTDRGVPCGSVSGLTVRLQNFIIRGTYTLPLESTKLDDTRARYYLTWRLALVGDVGSWVTPNPSTLVNLARFGDRHREELIRDVARGTIGQEFEIPEFALKACGRRLAANPVRARQLEAVVERTGRLLPRDIWPNLGLLGCWTGGTVGSYLRFFPEYFGNAAIRDIGLIATEARMTIPLEDGTPAGPLDVGSAFFEFIPAEEIDSPQPTVLEAHELQEGRDYFILLTTASGLYRYNIHDVVRCTGWFRKTPLLQFLSKGRRISSVTGEKISEHQVVDAVNRAAAALDLRLNSYALAPCWPGETPYYGLFLERRDVPDGRQAERLVAETDRLLRETNCEYESKRLSDRLGAIQPEFLSDGAWERWDLRQRRKSGGTAEQYKHPFLIPDLEFAAGIRADEEAADGAELPTGMTPAEALAPRS